MALQKGVKSRLPGASLLYVLTHHTVIPKWETMNPFHQRGQGLYAETLHCRTSYEHKEKRVWVQYMNWQMGVEKFLATICGAIVEVPYANLV